MTSTQEWMQMQAQYEAEDLYRRAYRRGWLGRIGSALHGQSPYLLNLADLAPTWMIQAQHFAGSQTVRIRQIRGSEGRSAYFDRSFRLLQQYTRRRWLSVAQAWLLGVNLPPIDLIQVERMYREQTT